MSENEISLRDLRQIRNTWKRYFSAELPKIQHGIPAHFSIPIGRWPDIDIQLASNRKTLDHCIDLAIYLFADDVIRALPPDAKNNQSISMNKANFIVCVIDHLQAKSYAPNDKRRIILRFDHKTEINSNRETTVIAPADTYYIEERHDRANDIFLKYAEDRIGAMYEQHLNGNVRTK